MNERIQKLTEQFKKMNLAIKIAIFTVIGALLLLLFFNFFMPDKYQVLYTGLDEKDQTEIEKYLSGKSIEYQYNQETGTLSVNGDVIQLKKDLALEGLPSGGSAGGLEQFSELSLGATQYDKNVQYQNALQDELSNSITGMFEGISSAEVKIPIAEEKSIFDDENKETSVSVALKLRSGYDLSPEQVKAVQVFVAGGIKDVQPKDVQVVDQNFNLLSSTEESSSTSLSKQQQIVSETKAKLEKELESTLSEVYGRVQIVANVNINFDEIVQNIKKYDPDGTILSREQSNDNERTISGDDLEVPGTDENGEVPNYELDEAENQELLSVKDKDNIIENFAVGETVEKVIKQPELRNTNISIWFDDELMTEEERLSAQEMVAVAAGLTGEAQIANNDKAIYDNGSVKTTIRKFAQQPNEEEPEEEVKEEGFFSSLPWYVYLIGAILFIGVIGLVIFLAIRRNKKKNDEPEDMAMLLEENAVQIPSSTNEELKEEKDELESLNSKFNLELNEEQKGLRDMTNDVAKKLPKETADVISKIMKDN